MPVVEPEPVMRAFGLSFGTRPFSCSITDAPADCPMGEAMATHWKPWRGGMRTGRASRISADDVGTPLFARGRRLSEKKPSRPPANGVYAVKVVSWGLSPATSCQKYWFWVWW